MRGIKQKWGIRLMRFSRSRLLLVGAIMVAAGIAGAVGLSKVGAYEGDYWTLTNEDGLSITVTSVSQNGVSLVPQSDGDGGYYFNVANNTDAVDVSMIVNGMLPGESYYYYESDDYFNGRKNLTSENNGQSIHEEVKPHVYFYENSSDPMNGKYYVGASVSATSRVGVQKNLVVQPTSIGSQNIEIVSVKQGNTNLALTDNEFQIVDYNAPVSVTYTFSNLEIGRNYSVDIGYVDYYQFRAEAAEATTTREISLDLASRHASTRISLQSSGDYEQVYLYFKVADPMFFPLGDIVVDDIEQGDEPLEYVEDTSSGWRREYNFTANDAQGLTVWLHTTLATLDMNYYVSYNISSYGRGYSSDEPLMVTGEQLEREGIMLPISAAYGLTDDSTYTLSISINTTGTMSYSAGSQRIIFKQYAEQQRNSDALLFTFYEDENVPRYDATMYYSDGARVESDVIDPSRHDADHPLLLEVTGERYDAGKTYDIIAKVKTGSELYHSTTLTATGAELNEGTVFTLTGLTLELPEFDPSGETSGYELSYEFSLEVDGLKQSGVMYFAYPGRLKSSMTYNDGEVVAMGGGGAIGGDLYTTINTATVRKSSLSGSRGATLHYLASGFDESLSYDLAVYYNSNAGSEWWSASAGNRIENGITTGSALNSEGLTVNITAPSNESESVLYTVVISRNGGIVALAKDFIDFTTEPKIESFKFTADSDSFMQTDRSSYRVATGTDIAATLTGDGFTNETEYKLWVSYDGYRYGEEEDEYGYRYPEEVDLSALDESVIVTGAQLNAGYVYNLDYVEAFDAISFVEVGFAVSEKDATEPSWYSETGNGHYAGHAIHIDYVNEDEVFRDNGYQVNEDGSVVDVSEPDAPAGVPVDDRTPGGVDVIVEGDTVTVVSREPVLVIGRINDSWSLVELDNSVDNDGEKTNTYDIAGYDEIKVVLKGDGDMDGEVSSSDSNLINRSLISSSLRPYRELSALEQIIFDLDGDEEVTSSDSNLLNRSLISPSLRPYHPIDW